MNIQVSAKTITDVHAYLAEAAARHRRLMSPAIRRTPVHVVVKPVEAPLRPKLYRAHDAHIIAWQRWKAADGSPLKNYIVQRCDEIGIPYDVMVSARKTNDVAIPRQMLMWEIKNIVKPTASYPEIGRLFGGRDHTTALHGIRKHERRRADVSKS